MDIFRTLASGSLSVTAMLDFSGKANTSIHGLGEDDTATSTMCYTSVAIGHSQYSPADQLPIEKTRETLVCCLPALIWLSSQTSGVQSICVAEKVSACHFNRFLRWS